MAVEDKRLRSCALPSNGGLGLLDRINAHIRQLSPHMMQRDGVVLLRDSRDEIVKLRTAARLIHDRHKMVSGSLEMAECDEFCKSLGLEVWTWPL